MKGLKDIASDVLARKNSNFQYHGEQDNYLLHVKYLPEVRLFLFVESAENQAIAQVRHALYINFAVFALIVLATIILTNMTVSFYQKKLALMATVDHLTQLLNRQSFETLSNTILADSRRFNTPLAVMMLDIDYFKNINDNLGLTRLSLICSLNNRFQRFLAHKTRLFRLRSTQEWQCNA